MIWRDHSEQVAKYPPSRQNEGASGRGPGLPCVWYISKYVAPPSGPGGSGVGGRGYELMRELAASGRECVIITSDASHLAVVPELRESHLVQHRDGMTMLWLRTLKAPQPRSLRRILGWVHFEWRLLRMPAELLPRPDVVVVSSLSLLTVLNGIRLQRALGVRLVFEVRDIWPLSLVDESSISARHPIVRMLALVERFGYRRADAIVGTMPNLGEHVARVTGRPRTVHCIPQGYSEASLTESPSTTDHLALAGVPAETFTLVYAGTIGVANALDGFFEAAESLRQCDDVHFVVVGDGALLPHYRHRFAHLPNLTFVPKVPKEDVPSLLAQCDVLYLGTKNVERWRYGQSLNKLIDYMLAGRPILASYSGYRSMIDEADCGWFVPAGDTDALVRAIRTCMDLDSDALGRMGRRGRDWVVQHREFSTLARQYGEILFPTG